MHVQATVPAAQAHEVTFQSTAASAALWGGRAERIGHLVLRYGMVFVLLFFGAFKFTEMEAKAIEPLVANSPFMSWLYTFLGTQTVAGLVGAVEIAIAVAIASRPLSPAASAIGSIAAAAMFMATFSFLFTTPGVWVRVAGWFPVPVPNEAGGFLAKDLFLIGAALWSAGEALQAIPRIRTWKVGLR